MVSASTTAAAATSASTATSTSSAASATAAAAATAGECSARAAGAPAARPGFPVRFVRQQRTHMRKEDRRDSIQSVGRGKPNEIRIRAAGTKQVGAEAQAAEKRLDVFEEFFGSLHLRADLLDRKSTRLNSSH